MNHRNAHTDPDSIAATGESRELHPAVLTGSLITGLIVALIVAAASFKLSFSTLFDLAMMASLKESDAWVIPVVLDGPILAAGIIRIALSQHTDSSTVAGRRFIVAVFVLAGAGSMAGNAYHAVLTVNALNAAVAAVIGALAPLMVMTMSEMIAIAISAPRRHRASTDAKQQTAPQLVELAHAPAPQAPYGDDLEELIDEHGNLTDDVWETVDLYLNHPVAKGNFSAVARIQGKSTSTITRRYDRWIEAQQSVAATKAEQAQHHLESADRTPKMPSGNAVVGGVDVDHDAAHNVNLIGATR